MSLNGSYDTDNIFAKILRGEIPCAKVYEDEHVLSFMDAFPQTQGHTLVIPKTPSRNLLDTEGDVLACLIARAQMIAKAVNAALSPKGIILTQFSGASAGQTVFHLHFHVIPRYGVEDIRSHATGEMANMDALKSLAEKISAEIKT